MERVHEACAGLASFTGGLPVLRQQIVDSARDIFQPVVSGMIVREGESYQPAAVCPGTEDLVNAKALMEHARSYARQAIDKNQQLSFKFSYRSDEKEATYHGLAQPILTTATAAVLLMVRKSAFTAAEISAFSVMGNIARMALDNSELANLYGVQKQKLDQLLEISAELGTSRLESFFPAFVVRAADFLHVSRVFVALVDQAGSILIYQLSPSACWIPETRTSVRTSTSFRRLRNRSCGAGSLT
jgi:hypothetical protein